MSKSAKTKILALAILTFVVIASYFNFANYKPKALRQVEDVKGMHSEENNDIPLLEGAEKVGVNRSSNTTQTTFHTNKTKEEVQDFYKNIFTATKWDLESQGVYTDFIVARYQKDNQTVNVITMDTQDDFKTLVSLETNKL